VGCQFKLFTDDACRMIAGASRGIPRTINILCDTALVYGFATEVYQITAELVATVIENKQQYGVLPLSELRA
jgi:type II secretory pathway predicted ATPase ExeA